MPLRKTKTEAGPPSKKTKNRGTKQPLLGHEAIVVSYQLHTTMLCTNRTLGEQGLSRLIVGYYKDLMAEDILERLEMVSAGLASAADRVTRRIIALLQELAEYMRYFSSKLPLTKKIFSIIKTAAHDKPFLRPIIAEMVLDRAVVTAKAMEKELSLPLVIFLLNLLYPHETTGSIITANTVVSTQLPLQMVDVDWKNKAVDVIMDNGCKDLILTTADRERSGEISIFGCERLVSFLSSNLSRRQSLKHNLLAMDFIVSQLKFNAMRMQILLQQPLFIRQGQQQG
jgi:hypothetical protein